MKKAGMRRVLAGVLCVCMAVAPMASVRAAAVEIVPISAPIAPMHWAAEQLAAWQEKGWLTGGADGDLNPDGRVTRAEFMALVNRMMGYSERSDRVDDYGDVAADSWYRETVAVALAAGYIEGADGQMRPEARMTRFEAAAILARLAGFAPDAADDAVLENLPDGADVPDWARGAVTAVVREGLLAGIDGKLAGTRDISRAETVVLLDRLDTETRVFGFAGTYGGTQDSPMTAGNIILAAEGITLRHVRAARLEIGVGVGAGSATVEDAVIDGDVVVNGGGADAVLLTRVTINGELIVNKPGVQVVVTDGPHTGALPRLPAPSVTDRVILAPGSKGVAGDGKVTGLETDRFYKVKTGGETLYLAPYMLHQEMSQCFGLLSYMAGTIEGLTNGQTYEFIEAEPLDTASVRVYSRTDGGEVTHLAEISDGMLVFRQADLAGMGDTFTVYADMEDVLGTPSAGNPIKLTKSVSCYNLYENTGPRGWPVRDAYALRLIDDPPDGVRTWLPYADWSDAGVAFAPVTEENFPDKPYYIFNYGDYVPESQAHLRGMTELTISTLAHDGFYLLDNGETFTYLTINVLPSDLSVARYEAIETLKDTYWVQSSKYMTYGSQAEETEVDRAYNRYYDEMDCIIADILAAEDIDAIEAVDKERLEWLRQEYYDAIYQMRIDELFGERADVVDGLRSRYATGLVQQFMLLGRLEMLLVQELDPVLGVEAYEFPYIDRALALLEDAPAPVITGDAMDTPGYYKIIVDEGRPVQRVTEIDVMQWLADGLPPLETVTEVWYLGADGFPYYSIDDIGICVPDPAAFAREGGVYTVVRADALTEVKLDAVAALRGDDPGFSRFIAGEIGAPNDVAIARETYDAALAAAVAAIFEAEDADAVAAVDRDGVDEARTMYLIEVITRQVQECYGDQLAALEEKAGPNPPRSAFAIGLWQAASLATRAEMQIATALGSVAGIEAYEFPYYGAAIEAYLAASPPVIHGEIDGPGYYQLIVDEGEKVFGEAFDFDVWLDAGMPSLETVTTVLYFGADGDLYTDADDIGVCTPDLTDLGSWGGVYTVVKLDPTELEP